MPQHGADTPMGTTMPCGIGRLETIVDGFTGERQPDEDGSPCDSLSVKTSRTSPC